MSDTSVRYVCRSRAYRFECHHRHYCVKDEDDLIKQIELDDELSKEFEDAELVQGRMVSVSAATSEHERSCDQQRHDDRSCAAEG